MTASTRPLCFLSFRPHAVSLAVRKDAARRRDILSRVNIVKRIKIGGRWKMFSIPRNAKGNYDWNAIADGRYYVEWYAGGTRRRVSAGVTGAQALEVQRRKHHELEGRKLGIPGFETAGETVKKPALHVAIARVLEYDHRHSPRHRLHLRAENLAQRFFTTNRQDRHCQRGPRKLRKVLQCMIEGNEIGPARFHPSRPRVGGRVGFPVSLGDLHRWAADFGVSSRPRRAVH